MRFIFLCCSFKLLYKNPGLPSAYFDEVVTIGFFFTRKKKLPCNIMKGF